MFRLLGLLAGIAGVTDLGTGGGPDESVRRCVLAARLARELGCSDGDVADVMQTALLEHLGCTAYAHESAGAFGDDVAVVRAMLLLDATSSVDPFRTFVPRVAAATGWSRARVAATLLRTGSTMARQAPVATCEVAAGAARALGLGPGVVDSLGHVTAMWNGEGHPGTRGEDIPLPARVMQVAAVAVMYAGIGGEPAAVAQVRRRSGGELDPAVASAFLARAGDLVAGLESQDPVEAALALEPDPVVRVDEGQRLQVARVCGDLVDLKSPWLHGHSAAVAELAGAAASSLGLPESDDVRVAAHLHDVGRVGIPGRIWSCPRAWTVAERDQARLHPYLTERTLARVDELSSLADLAGAHHERLDGTGYHRGRRADQLSLAARVLAAADTYRDLVEDRAHRAGLPASRASATLEAAVAAGRLDPDAVAAVLGVAAGGTPRRTNPAGLTPRQLEVLRLVTHGLPNREIARRLSLSPRTVDRHVADVYQRIGVSSRAAAAFFAMEHGLLGPGPTDEHG